MVILKIDLTKVVVNLTEVTGQEATVTNEYKEAFQEANIPGTSLVTLSDQI